MKTRKEAANFVAEQMHDNWYECSRKKGDQWHYGVQELRELLDFIYDRPPTPTEYIPSWRDWVDANK